LIFGANPQRIVVLENHAGGHVKEWHVIDNLASLREFDD